MRRDALGRRNKGGWDYPNPSYDVERYRKHYFYTDFDFLKTKFVNQCYTTKAFEPQGTRPGEGNCAIDPDKSVDDKSVGEGQPTDHEYSDFVPHKVAVRIRSTVKFSIMLDCGAPEIGADQAVKDMLDNEKEKPFDYESVPILRNFKINALREIIK